MINYCTVSLVNKNVYCKFIYAHSSNSAGFIVILMVNWWLPSHLLTYRDGTTVKTITTYYLLRNPLILLFLFILITRNYNEQNQLQLKKIGTLTTGTRIPDHPFPSFGPPPAIMVWILVWKYTFEPFIHILQHFVLQLSRSTNFCRILSVKRQLDLETS